MLKKPPHAAMIVSGLVTVYSITNSIYLSYITGSFIPISLVTFGCLSASYSAIQIKTKYKFYQEKLVTLKYLNSKIPYLSDYQRNAAESIIDTYARTQQEEAWYKLQVVRSLIDKPFSEISKYLYNFKFSCHKLIVPDQYEHASNVLEKANAAFSQTINAQIQQLEALYTNAYEMAKEALPRIYKTIGLSSTQSEILYNYYTYKTAEEAASQAASEVYYAETNFNKCWSSKDIISGFMLSAISLGTSFFIQAKHLAILKCSLLKDWSKIGLTLENCIPPTLNEGKPLYIKNHTDYIITGYIDSKEACQGVHGKYEFFEMDLSFFGKTGNGCIALPKEQKGLIKWMWDSLAGSSQCQLLKDWSKIGIIQETCTPPEISKGKPLYIEIGLNYMVAGYIEPEQPCEGVHGDYEFLEVDLTYIGKTDNECVAVPKIQD